MAGASGVAPHHRVLGRAAPVCAASIDVAARLGHGFSPSALARRLADRLHVQQTGSAPERDRGEFLLAPPVGVRLLLGLLPALVGTGGTARLQALQGPRHTTRRRGFHRGR
jgi:hypothetical protein